MKVTTQSWKRKDRAERWGYVLTEDNGILVYVSPYRYHTEDSARSAGELDQANLERWNSDADQSG